VVELFFAEVRRQRKRSGIRGRIVHSAVEPPEMLHGLRNHVFHIGCLRHIGGDK
jgi:hypothetical protein